MENKIFEQQVPYWSNSKEIEELNNNWSDSNQITKLLQNEQTTYDIKSCIAVKKLDSSIFQFKELADKAKQIIKERTKIYRKFKLLFPKEEDDKFCEDQTLLGQNELSKQLDSANNALKSTSGQIKSVQGCVDPKISGKINE